MKLFNTITVITVSSALMLGGCITYPDRHTETSKPPCTDSAAQRPAASSAH